MTSTVADRTDTDEPTVDAVTHVTCSTYAHLLTYFYLFIVLRKEDNDWVKKSMEYEVEGPRPRGRPKRTWREVVKEDCQARKLNTGEHTMDRSKWRKLIKDVRWSGWVCIWVWVSFFWYRPTRVGPDQRPLNGCVCVCVCVCYFAQNSRTVKFQYTTQTGTARLKSTNSRPSLNTKTYATHSIVTVQSNRLTNLHIFMIFWRKHTRSFTYLFLFKSCEVKRVPHY